MNTYLEDQKQLDKVYCYLNELYTTAAATTSSLRKLKFIDLVTFILDVLLPEVRISILLLKVANCLPCALLLLLLPCRQSSLLSLEWTKSHFRRQRKSS